MTGGDYPLQVYNSVIWEWFRNCGSCIFWNGALNGGFPTFADIQGSQLHPLVILTTLIWGVINGSKMIMLVVLMLAGFSQWWLAKELGFGRLTRGLTGILAVVGPQIGPKAQGGLLNIVLATVMASLMLPLIVRMFKRGSNPKIVVSLGVLLALLIFSGQGYIQLSFLLGICPVIFFLLNELFEPFKLKPLWKDFAKAALLGALLVGILILPYLHLTSAVDKEGNLGLDYGLSISQTLHALVGHVEFDTAWQLYIGWIPLILFGVGLLFSRKEDRKTVWALAISAILILFCSTNDFLKIAYQVVPSIDRVRFPDLLAGLSIPLILAVVGFGIENLTQLHLEMRNVLSARWVNLFPILAIIFLGIYGFSAIRLKQENAMGMYLVRIDDSADIDFLFDTPDVQWISGLEDDHSFDLRFLLAGYNQVGVYRPFYWMDRTQPGPFLNLFFEVPPETEPVYKTYQNLWLVKDTQNIFAGVDANAQQTPCTADNTGGWISVVCDTNDPGVLTVKEFFWPGWKLRIDGQPATLYHNGDWLAAMAQPGTHTYEFLYDPLDVKLGALMTLIGIITAVIWLRKKPEVTY